MKFEIAQRFLQETKSVIDIQIKMLKLAEREAKDSITRNNILPVYNSLSNYTRI